MDPNLTSKTKQGRSCQPSLQSIGSNRQNPDTATAKQGGNTKHHRHLELDAVKQAVHPVSSLNPLKRKVSRTDTFMSPSANKRSRQSISYSSSSDQRASRNSSYSAKRKRNNQGRVALSPASPRSSSSSSDSSGSCSYPDSDSDESPRPAFPPSSQSVHANEKRGTSATSVAGKSVAPFVLVQWTPEQDARLWRGMRLLRASGWGAVAECVGDRMTVAQCQTRWETALAFQGQDVTKTGAWSDDEVTRLAALVQQYTIAPYWSEHHQVMTREHVSWTVIGRELGRESVACYRKWKGLSIVEVSQLVSGGSAGELAGDQSEGEQSTSDEGERSSGHDTPRAAAPKRAPKAPHSSTRFLKWSPDEDKKLREGVRLYKESGGWKPVAEFVGGGRTYKQCKVRYHSTIQHVDAGLSIDATWSEAEANFLTSLVQRHTIAPYWSEQYKVMTQEHVDWISISKELNKKPKDCVKKWDNMAAAKMKKGVFTPDEDALIIHAVKEWGDKGNGLWVSLQGDLGRHGDIIRQRWNRVLSEKLKV